MRIIGPLQGYAAYTAEAPEEFQPEGGIVHREIIDLVRQRYNFIVYPTITPATPPPPLMVFQGGKFVDGGHSFAVPQLAMGPDHDVVVCVTTEQASIVLSDLTNLLDKGLGFRLAQARKIEIFLSNLVVEFSEPLEAYIDKLSAISAAINAERPGAPTFNIKRLAFGSGDIMPVTGVDHITIMRTADFLIERRQGFPYEANRYFCSAPMKTQDHIRTLERVEAAIGQ